MTCEVPLFVWNITEHNIKAWPISNNQSKMKIFKEMRILWLMYGIGLRRPSFERRTLIAIAMFCVAIISNFVYCIWKAKTILEYADSLFTITIMISSTICFTYFSWNKQAFFDHFRDGEEMINASELNAKKRNDFFPLFFLKNQFSFTTTTTTKFSGLENPKSKKNYENFNRITDILTKALYISGIVAYFLAMLLFLSMNLYNYFVLDLGVDSFRLPFPYWYVLADLRIWVVFNLISLNSFRFPFDWKSPYGYMIAFILSYILHRNLLYFLICTIATATGTYTLIALLTKEIKNDLLAFRKLVKSDPNPMMYFKPLYRLIEFQWKLKRWARKRINWL